MVCTGRSSGKAVLKYVLLDTTHRATSIRLCNYDENLRRLTTLYREYPSRARPP